MHAGVSVRQARHGEVIRLSFDVLLGPDPSGGTLELSALDGPAAWAASGAVHSQGCSKVTPLQVGPGPVAEWCPCMHRLIIPSLAACRWR